MLLKYSFAFLKHGSLWTYRVATYSVLIAGLSFVALVLGLRYVVLPTINNYREPIAQAIAGSAGQRISIGSITGSWHGYRPELSFMDVKVFAADGAPALSLNRVEAELSWLPLLWGQWRFNSLAIYGPELEIRRDTEGVLWVAGLAMQSRDGGGGFGDWLLAQHQVQVRDATLDWLDEFRNAPRIRLNKVNFRLDNTGNTHRFGLTAIPPVHLASPLDARGEFLGRGLRGVQSWNGRLHVAIDYADLAQAQIWLPIPLHLVSGLGSLRLWLGMNPDGIVAATADVRLANVQTRLASDLPELFLTEAQGRLSWARRGPQTEVSAIDFGFTSINGPKLPPARFTYTRLDRPDGTRRSELRLARLELEAVARLAEFLPLDAAVRGQMARIAPTGTVEDARVSWEGDWVNRTSYEAEARFSALSAQPDGALPGFRGVSGQLDANERGGTLALKATNAAVEFPALFAGPLPLDYFTVSTEWKLRDGIVDLAVKSANVTNEHLAGSISGTYRSTPEGRGSVDLTGMLVRGDAREIWRYVPLTAPNTQSWAKRALVAGTSKDTRFRLKGPLAGFPFADGKDGIFEVKIQVNDATIDYARDWPPATAVSGEVVFRGDRMQVTGRSGTILGLKLAGVEASVAGLGKRNEHLLITGAVQGPTPEFLHYVASIPVAENVRKFTAKMRASGNATLDLELDLPLHDAKSSTFKGDLLLQDNLVTLDPRLPPLEQFGARIAFTRESVKISEGRASLFGEPLSFEAANQSDGGIAGSMAGTFSVEGLRAGSKHPALALVQGKSFWRGSFRARETDTSIRFDSDLVGLNSALPPPFDKSAQPSLPLSLELREPSAGPRVLAVGIGKIASAQLVLDAAAPGGVRRGTVNFGSAPAILPDRDGLWVRGRLGVVDLDAWQAALGSGGERSQINLAGIGLQLDALDVNGRRFHDLKVEALRNGAAWQATLAGREIAGQASWAPEGDGRLAARLSRFILPSIATQIRASKSGSEVALRLPAIDLVADSFTYDNRDLGRLVVVAAQQGFGSQTGAGWQLQQLEIANPDSRFSMNGRWVTGDLSRTDVQVKLEVSDLGKFLARLGWPDTVKGGSAMLEGPIAWSGNPTRFDMPSLSGHLTLQAKNGQFQTIEPGVAKLLGILSLQALPRRINLDFRDVFSKGFRFDRISSNLHINAGVADTQDFLMDGSAAQVRMRGQVDLAGETQALAVHVKPSLSESIAIAGAILNPAIGVAALIAQKALKDPFSEIAAFNYSITGTWADPVVTRVARPSANIKDRGQ